ncbi:hypothetical protein SUB233_01462 [Streptococcus uberis]
MNIVIKSYPQAVEKSKYYYLIGFEAKKLVEKFEIKKEFINKLFEFVDNSVEFFGILIMKLKCTTSIFFLR